LGEWRGGRKLAQDSLGPKTASLERCSLAEKAAVRQYDYGAVDRGSRRKQGFMSARILIVDDSPTIRKVVASILERHDYETLGATDGLHAMQVLASEERKPDLMLVDFVMPKMNGYQLCMSVRDKPEYADVPVVLMSAKGDRIRGKFVQQTGALDAITKPFDARGLVAVIESALKKKEEAKNRTSDDEDEVPSRDSWGDATNRHQGLLKVAGKLAELFVQQMPKSPHTRDEIAMAFNQALTPDVSAALGQDFSDAALLGGGGEDLSGDLASISIAEILQLLEVQRKTGMLTLTHQKIRVNLFLRDGDLDFATHAGLPHEFLLGRYLVDKGNLSRDDLKKHIQAAREVKKRLGDYLVSEDILAADVLHQALVQQTSELVYEIVRWRKGRFRFSQGESAADADESGTRLSLRTAGLVMEGFRRVDEWRLIEDSFDFGDVLFRDDMAIDNLSEQEQLRDEERAALAAIDGDATVGEILDKLGGSSFESCKVLYRLLNGRLVKRRTS
jgi:CheY-like chemotaxis protein